MCVSGAFDDGTVSQAGEIGIMTRFFLIVNFIGKPNHELITPQTL
jgi:hypothetical protein